MSNEYTGAIVILIVSILKMFKIEIGTDTISSLVIGVAGLWVAIARYRKGDITVLGVRK